MDGTAANHLWSFAFSDVTDFVRYQQLYDQFRIKSVTLHFLPSYNVVTNALQSNATGSGLTTIMGKGYWFLWVAMSGDYSEWTTNSYTSVHNLHFLRFDEYSKFKFYPKPLQYNYESAGQGAYATTNEAWMDCIGDQTCPHYGIMWNGPEYVGSYTPTSTVDTTNITVFSEYELEFRINQM